MSADSTALALARDDQWSRRGEPHVAPLVAFADRLAIAHGLPAAVGAVPLPESERWGVHARVLLLLNVADGGARIDTGGSGMLTIDNDDRASLRQRRAAQQTGLDLTSVLHCNAIRWFVAEDERPRHVREGARALLELLGMLPDLRGVVLLGAWSRKVWTEARGTSTRYRHLAHAHGNAPTRTSNIDLLTAYRQAVKFAAMP